MPTIDERVVEMRFDNGQFERNVDQSMSTLDKLKAALNFDKTADGLKNLQNAGRGFNLNPVATAVETVTGKLSAMEIIGISALNRLTNQGMAMMERFVKSVSTDQITAGFTKYGQKTSAVQTIMAATAKDFEGVGGQMEYVNEQLTKLNWFTDETSYSFLDMVNNIGKFTSNGIKLDQAVTSMQGISTWAALSGANVQEASRAMYNLSQAVSTGSVKLIDWKSIENANMATAEFKETVIQTALEMGTLQKKGDKVFVKGSKKAEVSVKNFNSELAKGWFSSEVLLKSLDRYGAFTNTLYEFADASELNVTEILRMIDDYTAGSLDMELAMQDTGLSAKELTEYLDKLTSKEMALGQKAFRAAREAKTFQEAIDSVKDAVSTGWMNTFEQIFGNYEEAKVLWTDLSERLWNTFASGAERRNEILDLWHNGWKELGEDGKVIEEVKGAYEDLWTAVGNIWDGIENMLSPVRDAWDIIFGVSKKDRARQLIQWTKNFKDFSVKVEGFIKRVASPFEKFGKTVDTVSKDVKGALDDVTKPLNKITDDAKKVGELISTVERTERDLGRLTKEVLADKYGTGDKRKKALRELGYSYEVVQNEINRLNNCSKRHQILQKDLEKVHQDTTKAVKEESEATEELSKDMTASERRYYNLLRIFRGLFSAVDIVKKGFTEAGKAVTKIFTHALEKAMPVFNGILGALGDFGDKVFEFRENLGKKNVIADFFNKVADAVNNFVDKFADFTSRVWNKIANSEALPRLIGALKSLKDTIVELVSAGLSKLMEMFNNVDTDKVSDIFDSIFGWIANTSSDVLEFIVNHKEDVKKFFGIFTDTVAKTIGGIGQALSDLWKGFDGYKNSSAKEVGGFFENLFATFNAMFADENSTFNKVKGSIDKFTKAITDLFTNMTPEKGGDLLKKGAFALMTVSIAEFILSLSGAVKSLKDIPKTIVQLLKGVVGALDAYQTGVRADAILKVAKAIGILALSIIALAFIPEDALTNATSSLIALMSVLALVMAAYAQIIKMKFQKYTEKSNPINSFLNFVRDVAEKFAKIAAIGAVFIGIAAAVAAFAYLVNIVKTVDYDAIGTAFAYMTLMMIEVGVFIAALMALDKKLGGTKLEGIGTAMFGLGVGLLAMSAALKVMSTIDSEKLGPAVLSVIGILAAMGGASFIGNGRTMLRMAIGMVILAGALAVLTPVLLAMSQLPIEEVNEVLKTLGISIAVLAGISMAMSAVDHFTKDGASSPADNLLKLAGSIAILAAVVIALGSNSATAAGIEAFAGILTVIALAGGWAIIISAGLETLSQTLISIAAAAIVFGAGCALVGVGIYLVAKAIPMLVDGIVHVYDQFQANGKKIIIVISALLLAIFAAIVLSKSGFIKAVSTLIGGFFEAVSKSIPKMLLTVASVVLMIIGFLTAIAPTLVDKLFELLISIIAGLGVTLRTRGAELMMALGVLLNGLFVMVLEAMRAVVSAVFGKAVGDFIFGNTIDDMEKSGEEMSKRLKESMEKHSSDIDLDGMIADSITEGTKAEEAAEKKGGSVIDNYEKGLSTDFDPKKVNLQDKTEGLIETAADNSKPAARKKAHEVSEELIAAGAEGIVEGEDDLYNASTNTLGIVSKKAAAQAAGMASLVGEQWDMGVAGGISKYSGVVHDAARIVATGISAVANKALVIKSPSKVGEKLGKFWDMGVGRGIAKNSNLATDPAEDSANAIAIKMRDALDTIGSSVIEELRPTISPVLDLSDIQNGANLVNGMFSGTTAQLAFAASGSFVPQKESMMDAFRMALSGSMEDISAKLDDINVNGVYKFETPVILNGREIARGTAEYTREELNKLDRINSRKGGRL